MKPKITVISVDGNMPPEEIMKMAQALFGADAINMDQAITEWANPMRDKLVELGFQIPIGCECGEKHGVEHYETLHLVAFLPVTMEGKGFVTPDHFSAIVHLKADKLLLLKKKCHTIEELEIAVSQFRLSLTNNHQNGDA